MERKNDHWIAEISRTNTPDQTWEFLGATMHWNGQDAVRALLPENTGTTHFVVDACGYHPSVDKSKNWSAYEVSVYDTTTKRSTFYGLVQAKIANPSS